VGGRSYALTLSIAALSTLIFPGLRPPAAQDIGNLVVGLGFVVICVMANIKNFIKLMSERGVMCVSTGR
jgi:hypothetical protein